jgi:hypothetical protein
MRAPSGSSPEGPWRTPRRHEGAFPEWVGFRNKELASSMRGTIGRVPGRASDSCCKGLLSAGMPAQSRLRGEVFLGCRRGRSAR